MNKWHGFWLGKLCGALTGAVQGGLSVFGIVGILTLIEDRLKSLPLILFAGIVLGGMIGAMIGAMLGWLLAWGQIEQHVLPVWMFITALIGLLGTIWLAGELIFAPTLGLWSGLLAGWLGGRIFESRLLTQNSV